MEELNVDATEIIHKLGQQIGQLNVDLLVKDHIISQLRAALGSKTDSSLAE